MEKLELYREPLEILNRFENKGYTGMSDFDLSFLCGAIKKFRPKKIVEVGVAAGGTTAVIINCVKLLNYGCEMYSVDRSSRYYYDISKRTGFIAEQLIAEKFTDFVKHRFLLGNTVAASLDEIGGEIDFVILDTMHSLPGELLDFIPLYPFLNKKAVLVFHDVGQSQLGIHNINGAPYEYASLVTFSTLTGKKYVASDKKNIAGISNIGAIQLDESTPNSIENTFFSLFINWNYIPDKQSLEEYRQRIAKEYNEIYSKMFERAIECNVFSLYRRNGIKIPLNVIKDGLGKALKEAEKIYIYGAGKISRNITKYVERVLGEHIISGYIVTHKCLYSQKNIYTLEDIERDDNLLIILGLDEKHHLDVLDYLYEKGFSRQVFPYNGVGFREMIEFIMYENCIAENGGELCVSLNGYEKLIRNAARK